MRTQTIRGGFGKDEESPPGQFLASVIRTMGGQANSHTAIYPADVLHSYMGLATLSLMKEPGLTELDAALNIPIAAVNHLRKLRAHR